VRQLSERQFGTNLDVQLLWSRMWHHGGLTIGCVNAMYLCIGCVNAMYLCIGCVNAMYLCIVCVNAMYL
jgi:hypothetical protein